MQIEVVSIWYHLVDSAKQFALYCGRSSSELCESGKQLRHFDGLVLERGEGGLNSHDVAPPQQWHSEYWDE